MDAKRAFEGRVVMRRRAFKACSAMDRAVVATLLGAAAVAPFPAFAQAGAPASAAAAGQGTIQPTPGIGPSGGPPAPSSPVVAGPAASAGPAAPATPATTDSGIADIVVTAQKRSESAQRVPLSVVAINGQSLQNRGVRNIADLGNSLPGLQIKTNSGVTLPFLRGVGNSATSLGNEPSVAVYLDGVYFARLAAGFFSLNNIERVEVLKGPQGTLFGRNSTGGVISIVTRDPSHDSQVSGSLNYGRFNEFQGNLYATTGLSENLAIDTALSGHTEDGFGRNVTTGRHANYDHSFIGRSKLLFTPGDNTRITLSGLYAWSKVSSHGSTAPGTTSGTYSAPFEVFDPVASGFGFYDQRADYTPSHATKTLSGTLRIDQTLPFATLTSLTGYIHERETTYFDGDYGPRPDFIVYETPRVDQFTEELQLSSLSDSKLTWVGGLFYYHNFSRFGEFDFKSPSNVAALGFGPGINSHAEQKSDSIAGFAQVTYELLPRLKATGGIRYTHDKVSADGSLDLLLTPPLTVADPPGASKKINRATYRGALDYQITNTVLGYVSYSTGYKTSNFNLVTYNPNPNRPETIKAVEVGLKGDYFDRRLRLNAAAFHYKIGSPQVLLYSATGGFISNAGGSKVNGFEFDGQLAVVRGLLVRFGATYLDSKYTSYVNAPSNQPVPTGGNQAASIDATGNRTPLASKWSYNVGMDYRLPTSFGQLTFTVDYNYKTKFYWEPDNFLVQKGFGLLDAQARLALNNKLAVRVWGRNLTDRKYAVSELSQTGPAGFPYEAGRPVSYGVGLDFNF